MRRLYVRSAVTIAAIIAAAAPVAAWEIDVHYGLTYWLAQQAGFSQLQAKWIANGNQGFDDSVSTNPIRMTMSAACIGRDSTASRRVQFHHFSSKASPPAPPNQRLVVPGAIYDNGNPRQLPQMSGKPDAKGDFERLGEYLHTLQDSWSHQGEPDFPEPPCKSDLAWGHSRARGGWSCHLADLTYKWTETDSRAMAAETYTVLTGLSRRFGGSVGHGELMIERTGKV